MEIGRIIAGVAVAVLTVIGFYGLLHGLFEGLLRPREIIPTVRLYEAADEAELDILLCEARRVPWTPRKQRVLLVIPEYLLLDGSMGKGGRLLDPYAALAEKYDAEVCAITALPDEQ